MLRKDYILWKVWIDISFSCLLNLISLQSLLEEYFPPQIFISPTIGSFYYSKFIIH